MLTSSLFCLEQAMPKKKTNKTAAKKLRVTGSGRVKRAQANTSHNSGKRAPKRKRNLRRIVSLDSANAAAAKKMLPYG
jgi:large subunit ribosomal protein L35